MHAVDLHGDGGVVAGVEERNEVVGLKDEAYVFATGPPHVDSGPAVVVKASFPEESYKARSDPAVDAGTAATMFIGTLQGQVMQAMIAGDNSALPEQAGKSFRLLRRALECRKDRER